MVCVERSLASCVHMLFQRAVLEGDGRVQQSCGQAIASLQKESYWFDELVRPGSCQPHYESLLAWAEKPAVPEKMTSLM